MGRLWRPAVVASICLSLAGCDQAASPPPPDPPPATATADLLAVMAGATAPTTLQRVEYVLTTPHSDGEVRFYVAVGTDVRPLSSVPLRRSVQGGYLEYSTPASSDASVLLAHVQKLVPRVHPVEYVCFAPIAHTGNRNRVDLACDLPSTLTYLMAAPSIGRSGASPFLDIVDRYPLWRDYYAARSTDLMAFLLAAFGTLQNALVTMAPERFDPRHQSLRPVLETAIARALDAYRLQGTLTAAELVAIAESVTGGDLPLARLLRFPDVYSALVTLTDTPLQSTAGTLTRRSAVLRPATLQSELDRFFLDRSPLEMTDVRTHSVQNLSHHVRADALELTWTPLPHIDGYNVYLNRVLVGWTREARWSLPRDAVGEVVIRAVGHAGELDGIRYSLDPLSLQDSAQ
jgi:hypothetical protein